MNPIQKTRRAFVKQSGVLAGGLLTLPALSRANFFSGADDVIKIALVGCGGRGTGAAMQALLTKQNVKLVAMADAFKDRLDDCYNTINADDLSDAGASFIYSNWRGARCIYRYGFYSSGHLRPGL